MFGPRRTFPRAVLIGTALAAALVGCGESEADRASAPAPAVTPLSPPGPATTPEPSGQAGSSGPVQPSGPAGSSAGSGGGSEESGGPGSEAPGSGRQATGPPSIQPSPVFVGEACAPERDTGPAFAVNGLVLYCVPAAGGSSGPPGRWSVYPPREQSVPRPEPGTECDPSDVGRIITDAQGRPVTCLREPNGELRWSDVS